MRLYGAMLQLPGAAQPNRSLMGWMQFGWDEMGFLRWALGLCGVIGVLVIIWKFFDLWSRSSKTRRVIKEVDELLAEHRINEAIEVCRESNAPGARILFAGLDRHEEGTDRVMKAIENQGLIELTRLERGLVVLATLTNVAPLLGFLGTVLGMIVAFQSIEMAGEVEATLVAGGIKIALLTTAAGLFIAIPTSIFHNYFVSRIDSLVIELEESAQKMVDALHAIHHDKAAAS